MSRRLPAVAGQFYSASAETLWADVVGYADPTAVRQDATVGISPHAGLRYSGHVAGAVYSRLLLPETVILIGPNHSGVGPPVSVFPEGSWLIPGGELSIDHSLARQILRRVRDAVADESAHRFEHCLEVQLPFLVQVRPDIQIVPIVLGTTDYTLCREIGLTLAEIIRDRLTQDGPGHAPLVIATTDMTHYEPDHIAREKDLMAIQAIQMVDPESLHATVTAHGISMCGVGPTVTALHTARALDAKTASLVRYATSGEVSRDLDHVVGYAGFIISSSGSPV